MAQQLTTSLNPTNLTGERQKKIITAIRGPGFCVVEEMRRFTQEQVDWRIEHDMTNFRHDLKTNASGIVECECEWGKDRSAPGA